MAHGCAKSWKETLADYRCRLRILVLDYNEFEPKEIALIADGLAANRSLRELSLQGNTVAGIGVQVITLRYGSLSSRLVPP